MLPASTHSVIFYSTIPTFRRNLLITPEGETTDMYMGQKILTNPKLLQHSNRWTTSKRDTNKAALLYGRFPGVRLSYGPKKINVLNIQIKFTGRNLADLVMVYCE